MLIKRLRVIFYLSLIALLSACGSDSKTSPDGDYSYSHSSLSFSAQIDGETPPAQIITLRAESLDAEVPDLIYNNDVIDTAWLRVESSDRAEITVNVISPVRLGIGTHTTILNLESSEGTVTIPITYTVLAIPPGEPEVHFISPYTVSSDESHPVVIRGSGFSRFDNINPPEVIIGGLAAINVEVVTDTMLRVSTPALPEGAHVVEVTGGDVVFTSITDLNVISAQTYATTTIETSGEKQKLIFDSGKRTIYIVNSTNDALERYRFIDGTTWIADSLSLSGMSDAALSPDGNTLVVVDGSSFYEVDSDAVRMVARRIIDAPLRVYDRVSRIASTSSGEMVSVGSSGSAVYIYNILTKDAAMLTFLNSNNSTVNHHFSYPRLFGVQDGAEIYIGETLSTSSLHVMDTGSNIITETDVTTDNYGFYSLSTTKDKSKILVNGKNIYNSDFTSLLGSLPDTYSSGVVSPDGNVAYVFIERDYDAMVSMILRAYDVSDPSTPVQIGSDAILSPGPGRNIKMEISDDGSTLFLVGSHWLNIIDLTTFSF
ncbi:MAG: IPT/TIG domain-containing protein [Candidatus Thiodiazotropha sp.]